MIQDKNELEAANELKKVLKPKLYRPIWNTIICSGPPLNLFFRYFLVKDIKNPTIVIILTAIAMIWAIINWYWYGKERNDFKKDWQKISAELDTLNFKEKSSKDNSDKVFNSLQITAIASLIACIIFLAIALCSKLSCFKYLAIFSILIFFLTAIGIIIISFILFFSFLKDVKKEGRLKKVLKRFFLIFTLLFIIQMIPIFIMHKDLDWFIPCLLYSLMMALPIIMAIEVTNIYIKIKKEYSMNASSDESDRK